MFCIFCNAVPSGSVNCEPVPTANKQSILNLQSHCMKSLLFGWFIVFLLLSQTSKGQDVCSQNPKYCKVLSDTGGIKMMLITLPPGAKLATHTHALNTGYIIQGSLFKTDYDDGRSKSMDLKPGFAFHGGPDKPHHAWNAGKTTLQMILVEKD